MEIYSISEAIGSPGVTTPLVKSFDSTLRLIVGGSGDESDNLSLDPILTVSSSFFLIYKDPVSFFLRYTDSSP